MSAKIMTKPALNKSKPSDCKDLLTVGTGEMCVISAEDVMLVCWLVD